jgi:CAAX protease family protein
MIRSAADRWKPWWGPVALVVGLLVGAVGGAIAAAAIPGGIRHGNTLSPAATDVATVIQDLAFVAAALALARLAAPLRPRQFGLLGPRSLWRAIGMIVAVGVLFLLVADIYFAALHTSGQEKSLVNKIGGNAGTLGVLAVCVLTTVIAPICEELLFRGFMFRALLNWRGFWPAAVITGIIFGLVHGASAPAVDLAPLAFLGFCLCALYYLTGSLYTTIGLHLINNALALSGDENWGGGRTLALLGGSLAAVALVLALVRLASERWTPVSD